MDSDSDTLSAGDSDDGYMDGIRVQADGSDPDHEDDDDDDDDKASDTFDATKSVNEIQGNKSMGHLTHLQKIKAQRKISSTPLHDYKNPSRILDPECVRGMVPVDKTKELSSSSSSDLKHNSNFQGSSGYVPGSRTHSSTDSSSPVNSPRRVKLEVFSEEEEDNVFAGDEKDEAANNVNGSDHDRTEEKENISEQSCKISNGQKQRRNGATSNPYMNGVRPGNKFSSSSPVDIHIENVSGEGVTTPEREEAKQSLINITSRDNFSRMDSADPRCRSRTNSLEGDQDQTAQKVIEELAAISDEESTTPDISNSSNLQKTRKFGKEEMSGAQNVSSGFNKSKFLDSDSSSDQEEKDNDVFDHNTRISQFNVIKLRPRTFTDTSTDDDEIRLKVTNRIKRMKKSGGESTA